MDGFGQLDLYHFWALRGAQVRTVIKIVLL